MTHFGKSQLPSGRALWENPHGKLFGNSKRELKPSDHSPMSRYLGNSSSSPLSSSSDIIKIPADNFIVTPGVTLSQKPPCQVTSRFLTLETVWDSKHLLLYTVNAWRWLSMQAIELILIYHVYWIRISRQTVQETLLLATVHHKGTIRLYIDIGEPRCY